MKVSGLYKVGAPRDRVWSALIDPVFLWMCVPGCQTLEPSGERTYAVTLKVGLAAVQGTYSGTVEVADLDEPHSLRLRVKGEGNGGFVEGEGTLTLAPPGDTTLVTEDDEAAGADQSGEADGSTDEAAPEADAIPSTGAARPSPVDDAEAARDITIVAVDGDARIGGRLASVGQRLAGGAAKLLIKQFFKALNAELHP